ncbi:MAG: uroporphyrinogen decarboxylase [Firmicutes bacterium]|nr:uroporphyrinogen decarboxylase [Bacillota bacterium]
MLTKRQNLMETIKGGKPDRFVNQYEFLELIREAPKEAFMTPIGTEAKNAWGITIRWPEGQIGSFPVHDSGHKVLKDITKWRDYVKAPSVDYPAERWTEAIAQANAVDRDEKFVTAFVTPGIFELTHYLMGMEDALMSYYEEPEAMHELIDYLTEYELRYAKHIIENLHPDALFHHDDWGSQISSFMSPETFKEFILPAYKKIYGFYKDNGVELIVHHSDSYGVNLVPFMIEMGIDIWQGVMNTNNIPELIKEYGGQISFMGGLHSGEIDFPDWTPEIVMEHVEKACNECGKIYFIPNLSQGAPISSFPGVYEATSEAIDKMSAKLF